VDFTLEEQRRGASRRYVDWRYRIRRVERISSYFSPVHVSASASTVRSRMDLRRSLKMPRLRVQVDHLVVHAFSGRLISYVQVRYG